MSIFVTDHLEEFNTEGKCALVIIQLVVLHKLHGFEAGLSHRVKVKMESTTSETIEVVETTTISPQFEMAQVASIMVQSLIAQSKTSDIYTTVTPNGILDNLKEASSNLESLDEHLNDTISEEQLKKEWQKTSEL